MNFPCTNCLTLSRYQGSKRSARLNKPGGIWVRSRQSHEYSHTYHIILKKYDYLYCVQKYYRISTHINNNFQKIILLILILRSTRSRRKLVRRKSVAYFFVCLQTIPAEKNAKIDGKSASQTYSTLIEENVNYISIITHTQADTYNNTRNCINIYKCTQSHTHIYKHTYTNNTNAACPHTDTVNNISLPVCIWIETKLDEQIC